jgi:hypothetical protein
MCYYLYSFSFYNWPLGCSVSALIVASSLSFKFPLYQIFQIQLGPVFVSNTLTRFEVFREVIFQIVVFWILTAYSSERAHRCVGGTHTKTYIKISWPTLQRISFDAESVNKLRQLLMLILSMLQTKHIVKKLRTFLFWTILVFCRPNIGERKLSCHLLTYGLSSMKIWSSYWNTRRRNIFVFKIRLRFQMLNAPISCGIENVRVIWT